MKILENAPCGQYCTFKTGGAADYLILPSTQNEVQQALDFCLKRRLEWFVIGRGSNVLVRDGGFRGAIICTRELRGCEFSGSQLTAAAGESLVAVCKRAIRLGLGGLEWAVGIPATVGGAVAMNAGAFGGEVANVVRSVRLLTKCGIENLSIDQCGFSYRHSIFLEKRGVILSAEFALRECDRAALEQFARECLCKRNASQPQGVLSAGSAFKRLKTHSAGELIDKCGLKGFCKGGAAVSTKHANFVINAHNASSADIEDLMEIIEHRVYEQFGERLMREIQIIGERVRS